MIARRAKQIKETRKDNLKKKKTNSNATCSSTAGSSSNLNVTFYLKNNQTHESITSTNQTRKQWKEKRTQTYETLILSTVCAFTEELKESSDIIYSKLRALCDLNSKTNVNSKKKSNQFTKEWRKNNRDLLDSGCQEIAEMFSNLRKVERNLKTIDWAVSTILKEKAKNVETSRDFPKRKDCQLDQKGLK